MHFCVLDFYSTSLLWCTNSAIAKRSAVIFHKLTGVKETLVSSTRSLVEEEDVTKVRANKKKQNR